MARAPGRPRYGANGPVEVIPLRPHRSWWVQAVIFLIRWSVEITVVLLGWWLVHRMQERTALGYGWVLMVLGLGFGTLMAIGPLRRLTLRSIWVAVTRHRMRAFFVQGRIYNRSGRLPWIVLARPTPVGERVWLWMVPGLSVLDVQDSTEQITAACWARTARVERHRGVGSLVLVDVVRRDPLTGTQPLLSTLLGRLRSTPPPTPTPMVTMQPIPGDATGRPDPLRAIDLRTAATEDPDLPVPARKQRPSRPVVRGVGGQDVSDYV